MNSKFPYHGVDNGLDMICVYTYLEMFVWFIFIKYYVTNFQLNENLSLNITFTHWIDVVLNACCISLQRWMSSLEQIHVYSSHMQNHKKKNDHFVYATNGIICSLHTIKCTYHEWNHSTTTHLNEWVILPKIALLDCKCRQAISKSVHVYVCKYV